MSPRITNRLVELDLDEPTKRTLNAYARMEGMRPWRYAALIVAEYVQRHMPQGHGGFPERPL